MKKTVAVLLILAMVFSFAACGTKNEGKNNNEKEVTSSLKLSLDEWPVIDGALGSLPYYENMAALLLDMPLEDARQYILDNNTPAAFSEIAEGKADLIFCLHGSKEQEQYAKDCGVTLKYVPYALDAFVFFVNKNNPVDSVSIEQLHDIYAGKITNWKELGGNDEEIIAYQRNEGSGSQTGLFEYVISEDEVINPPTEKRIADMGGIIDAVSHYDNSKAAIGFSYLYFVTNQHFDEDIKLLKVEGVEPSGENIRSRAYPMVTEKCCITTEEKYSDENSVERKIIDWCISKEGQALAESLSYVAAYKDAN